ncbi:uncharacterized protein LOC128869964 [Anastrepha ludens]|uniref:uncharacterized protein LOC128869964 n=1 Tax=Anastrepha ludens TaxID=28586 RepID=UPI0023B113B5|nr:uncharacterized protein LOC128869964 [Anastrepha ludens]
MPLGDRRPSDLFNEMKRSAGSALSESILDDLWVNRLPAYTQAAIIATNVPISEKLKMADSIVESIQLREGRVNEAWGIQNNSDSDLRTEIATLTQCLDKALDNGKTHYHSRSKTPARHRKSDNGSDDMCWYQRKFGQDAKRCRLPCKLTGSPPTNVSQQGCSAIGFSEIGKRSEMPSNFRIRIFDTSTKINFLIDSGADVSTISKCSKLARATPSDMKLFAGNGTPIQVFGEIKPTKGFCVEFCDF